MIKDGPMFNAYPDSCGGRLDDVVRLLGRRELSGLFRYFYILPSLFQSDLDRGFSVIAYELDEELARRADLDALKKAGIELKLDFVLNHLSAQSPQFLDLLQNGDGSTYVEFFIDWNRFWAGEGEPAEDGCIVPRQAHLDKLFMRKPGLPVAKVPFPDGSKRFYWNTFYQAWDGDRLLGQMDLNAESEDVWSFYEQTLEALASFGARIVRLDAFAYLHKEVGTANFLNEPGTWRYLDRIRKMADKRNLSLLPEIHAKHSDGVHRKLAGQGYPIYDFFFPALMIHAIETGDVTALATWITEAISEGYDLITMLGCHDGIPVLDVKGLLDDKEIDALIDIITSRGGRIKDLYGPDGKKVSYYQVNATFFSALAEDAQKMLLARAVQLFMPGVPQIWYLDLFAGTNDYKAADEGGHKEINRTDLSLEEIEERLQLPVVKKQLELLRFRAESPAFGVNGAARSFDRPGGGRQRPAGPDHPTVEPPVGDAGQGAASDAAAPGDTRPADATATVGLETPGSHELVITRAAAGHCARLTVNFRKLEYSIEEQGKSPS